MNCICTNDGLWQLTSVEKLYLFISIDTQLAGAATEEGQEWVEESSILSSDTVRSWCHVWGQVQLIVVGVAIVTICAYAQLLSLFYWTSPTLTTSVVVYKVILLLIPLTYIIKYYILWIYISIKIFRQTTGVIGFLIFSVKYLNNVENEGS